MCKEVAITDLPEKLSFNIQCREGVSMEKTPIIADPEEGWLCLPCLLCMEILRSVLSHSTSKIIIK